MRTFKRFGLLVASVAALAAFGATNASAGTFTASATGSLSGKATTTQTWTVAGGSIECTAAAVSGSIVSTASGEQLIEVDYSGCKGFGFIGVHINRAKWRVTWNGTVHLENTLTINLTGAACHVTIPPMTVNVVKFINTLNKLRKLFRLTGIPWTGTGGFCGTSGAAGAFHGDIEVERVGGGSISWDA